MTIGAKIRLVLTIIVLALLGVIIAVSTSQRDLVKPYPREADVQLSCTTPAEKEAQVKVVEPTADPEVETEPTVTVKPEPTKKSKEASPSAT